MAGFSDLDSWVNVLSNGGSVTPQDKFFSKLAYSGGAAWGTLSSRRMVSLWTASGNPCAGSAPGTTPRIPDNTTAGGLLQADPGGGRKSFLAGLTGIISSATGAFAVNQGSSLLLYDRLLDQSGLDANSTSVQTVGGTITRYTDGYGNWAASEIYTQVGATNRGHQISYTDDDGNSGQASIGCQIGAAAAQGQGLMIVHPLAATDMGVRAVANVTINVGGTGTTGSFGITIMHPLMWINCGPAGVNPGHIRDAIYSIPREILTDACLALAIIPGLTTMPDVHGSAHILEV